MKKAIFIYLVALLALFTTLLTLTVKSCNKLKGSLTKEDSLYKDMIGKKIVFLSDTVVIVDYSILKESFTLSNGQQVNSSMYLNK